MTWSGKRKGFITTKIRVLKVRNWVRIAYLIKNVRVMNWWVKVKILPRRKTTKAVNKIFKIID